MTAKTEGLHHVTAIAGDPQRNIDFYIRGLGLRLVKKTVNFDDPGTYHLYYGDEAGTPGSLLTFFPWQGVRSGRVGSGQSTTTAFSVPSGTLGWWQEHFKGIGVASTVSRASSEEERLSLRDPDGLQIDLVASSLTDPRNPWDSASVPAQYAVRGQHSSVLTVTDPEPTLETLTHDLGMRLLGESGGRYRLSTHDGEPGTVVDIVADPSGDPGLVAGGTVHHIAFRVPDQQTQEVWRQELAAGGYSVTAILDRQYFTSIYFREPGGTLLEMATDTPGFNIDEPLLELGRSLKLP
ncbi:VOC family protein, partial [Arthrobacter sp. Br18]|uniref:VOC family protein n=1 Tax=Arthrobacter sp. Br18 TaxID=1312954 RepID=UPI00056751CF